MNTNKIQSEYKGDVFMNTPKTITFRTDEETYEKIEKLKETLFRGKDVSNSEVLRYAIDSLYINRDKVFFEEEEVRNLVQSFITVGFLRSATLNPFNKVDFDLLANVSLMIDEVYEDYSYSEIKEAYKLYNDDENITIGKLVRFKNRILPQLFLQVMGAWKEEHESLSNDELADFILAKFTEEDFKKGAKEKFGIE